MDTIKDGMRRFSQGFALSGGGNAVPGYATMADENEDGATVRIQVPIAGSEAQTDDGRRLSVAMDISENTECIVQVQIPEGVKVGESLSVQAPGGKRLRVMVPPGYSPGDMIFVPVPKDEAKTDGLMGWARRRLSVMPK